MAKMKMTRALGAMHDMCTPLVKYLCHDQCNACRLGLNAYDVKMTLWVIKHNTLSNNSSMLDMASRTSKEFSQLT